MVLTLIQVWVVTLTQAGGTYSEPSVGSTYSEPGDGTYSEPGGWYLL